MKKIAFLITSFIFFILIMQTKVITALPMPVGVGGIVKINGVPVDDITVTLTNLDSGEKNTFSTQNGGIYAIAVSAMDGDILKVNLTFFGENYENSTVADLDRKTHWLNFSISFSSPPAPVVDANGPYLGLVNQAIYFNGSKSYDLDGEIVSYTWDFGDGITASGVNTTHTYKTPGIYNVTLTIKDNESIPNATTVQCIISPVIPPNPNFYWMPPNPLVGDPVQFFDTSNDPDGQIVNWTWDFGDGDISHSQNPSHSYRYGNSYRVTLNVTDNDGISNKINQQIIVNSPPEAKFTYEPTNPHTKDIIRFFDKSIDSYGKIVNWTWNFGDGNISYKQNPTHQYTENGTYIVQLIITDNCTEQNSSINKINVSTYAIPSAAKPWVNITYPSDNATIKGEVDITVEVSDENITKVVFELIKYNSTIETYICSCPPYNWNIDTSKYAKGPYSLKATVYNLWNDSSSSIIQILIMQEEQEKPDIPGFELISFLISFLLSIVIFLIIFRRSRKYE